MNKRIRVGSLFSVIAGLILTLVTGFIQTPMGHLGIDVVYWGVPLPWMMIVIPTRIQSVDSLNFTIDAIFWVAIACAATVSLLYFLKEQRR